MFLGNIITILVAFVCIVIKGAPLLSDEKECHMKYINNNLNHCIGMHDWNDLTRNQKKCLCKPTTKTCEDLQLELQRTTVRTTDKQLVIKGAPLLSNEQKCRMKYVNKNLNNCNGMHDWNDLTRSQKKFLCKPTTITCIQIFTWNFKQRISRLMNN